MSKRSITHLDQLLKFFLPFFVAFAGIALLYVYFVYIDDHITFMKLLFLMSAYFVPPLGKESIIPIGIAGGRLNLPFFTNSVYIPPITPLIMALSIAFVDIVVALFLVWNYDLAKKIPIVGKFISKVEKIGLKSSSKYSWIVPLRFIGIILFVMVPFQGSGGLVGSIIGRLIGMKPLNIFAAISIGSIVGCTIIAYFADVLRYFLIKNFLQALLVILVIVIFILMVRVYIRNSR
ncbi:MAG: small multi-drug export protein [Candidatus Thermoplasmatota archaeon]